ncbi:MAG: hypothetical protein GQ569_08690 [Methylococcaceae bacterium]|nr:hypothetical protein [Methylococcaceae bacterium]
MNTENIDTTPFIKNKVSFMLRGMFLSVAGFSITLLSLLNPEIKMMSYSGWLPVISFTLLITGILEILDSFIAKKTPLALVYSNFAIVDLVTGGIILFELHNSPQRLLLLITGYLFIKGSFRITAALQTKILNYQRIIVTGIISLILGLILWFWVSESLAVILMPTFIAIDVLIRGISLMVFSFSLGKLKNNTQEQES